MYCQSFEFDGRRLSDPLLEPFQETTVFPSHKTRVEFSFLSNRKFDGCACRSKRVDSAVLTDLSFFSRESFERSIDTRRAWASQFAEVADNITFHVCDLVSKQCGVNNIVYDIVFQLSLDGLGEKVGGAVITGLSDSDIG